MPCSCAQQQHPSYVAGRGGSEILLLRAGSRPGVSTQGSFQQLLIWISLQVITLATDFEAVHGARASSRNVKAVMGWSMAASKSKI